MPLALTCNCGETFEHLDALDAHQDEAHGSRTAPSTSFVPHVAVGSQRFVAKCRSCGVTQERVGEQPPRICPSCASAIADEIGGAVRRLK